MQYEIKGGSFPIVICKLQKGETMKDESGSMAFMTSEVKNGNKYWWRTFKRTWKSIIR